MPKFRLILSDIDTPGYSLAKFLIPILESLTHNQFTRKDFFSFATDIATYYSSLYMGSFDVESQFTNIPLNETINNCFSDLNNKNPYDGKLGERDLFKLLGTASSKSSFIFDYYLYKQVDEVAMGYPLDPTMQMPF